MSQKDKHVVFDMPMTISGKKHYPEGALPVNNGVYMTKKEAEF